MEDNELLIEFAKQAMIKVPLSTNLNTLNLTDYSDKCFTLAEEMLRQSKKYLK